MSGAGAGDRERRLAWLHQRVQGLAFGGDYNPEQWPESVWREDVAAMREAGVNLVSLGIFAWAQVEPRPGEFDFDWLDRVIDMLVEGGVSVALATMTASPPPWLAALHPESLPAREDGVRLWPGARQHYCPSSPVYREHAARLVEQLARRYGKHPALVLWHIGNEYGCHVARCWCEVSAAAFRRWLRQRYGDIDGLNHAWSTAFWSQRYSDFSEVNPPRAAPTFQNPAQQLDFRRFSSEELLDCYRLERDICLRLTPDVPVTTNLLSVWKEIDGFAWGAAMDVVSHDSYPDPREPNAAVGAAFAHDLIRSVGDGRPWLLMEQAPSAVNWRAVNAPKPPGMMRLWSYQALAHGADSILYFQWRQSRGGAEKFHSAMVPHAGTDSRTHLEVRALGRELERLGELRGAQVNSQAAIVFDWPSWWGLELDSHPSAAIGMHDACLAHYRPLWEEHASVDMVQPGGDLARYRLLVVPNLYMVSEADASRLCDYVRDGGRLLISFFSGIVDVCDRVYLGGYPAPFRRLLGIRIDEFWPLAPGELVELDLQLGDGAPPSSSGTLWSEWIVADSAEVIGRFSSGPLCGRPAVTRHRFGQGVAWYLGTRLDPASMRALVRSVLAESEIRPPLPHVPDGVEVGRRRSDRGTYLFLLNHGQAPASVTVPDGAVALLGTVENGHATLSGLDIAILRLPG